MIGFHRADGRVGIRNHLLVMPSVVCATNAAQSIAGSQGLAITHQHGCLHVGDDLEHTGRELAGTAGNPNVGAVVMVSLGCETLQGRRLAEQIAAGGQRISLVGIQSAGGTAAAVTEGREAVAGLRAELARETAEPCDPDRLLVGIDRTGGPLVAAVREASARRGWRSVTAPEGLSTGMAHVALAGEGAQIIVSLRDAGQAPLGFIACPVLAVACDNPLYTTLRDDFDLEAAEAPAVAGDEIALAIAETVAGTPTASERRGTRDFVLHRLTMTM